MIVMFITILFLILLILGIPIAYSLAIPCLIYFTFYEPSALSIVPLRIFAGFDAYTLISFPLFITMGMLMHVGGLTKVLIDVSMILFGKIKGGLVLVNVFASMIFGGISGSSVADTASIGEILIPEMLRRKYSVSVSTGVTVASSTIGMIIPPSIPMLLYAMASSNSVGKLFIAGAIPGILIGVFQLTISYILGKKNNWPTEKIKMNSRDIKETILKGLPAILMPFFVVGVMVFGVTTATEAAGLGVLYAAICGLFVYHELNLKTLIVTIKKSIYMSASIMLIITFSALFGWILVVEGVSEIVGNILFSLDIPNYAILLLFAFFLLFIGNFLDVGPAILLITPIFLPAMTKLGIDPIVFGVVLIVGLAVGFATPPIGQCLNVANKISGLNIVYIFLGSIPWLIANIITLVLVCLFPKLSLFLISFFKF